MKVELQTLKKGDQFNFNNTVWTIIRKWKNRDGDFEMSATDGYNTHRFYSETLEVTKVTNPVTK